MPKEEVPTAIVYVSLALIISFVPSLIFILFHKGIDSLNPVAFVLVTWLIVNVVSLLQFAVNAAIALGYALLFLIGSDEEDHNGQIR